MADQTFFDKVKRSFSDVTVHPDNGIETAQFLEACEGLVSLFGTLVSILALILITCDRFV
jgi:hypothetical protein